jgi:hypothetical protein
MVAQSLKSVIFPHFHHHNGGFCPKTWQISGLLLTLFTQLEHKINENYEKIDAGSWIAACGYCSARTTLVESDGKRTG